MQVATVGLDLAKRIFQVHATDASGHVVVRKALRRSQVMPFLAKLPLVSSASKPAAPRNIGRGN